MRFPDLLDNQLYKTLPSIPSEVIADISQNNRYPEYFRIVATKELEARNYRPEVEIEKPFQDDITRVKIGPWIKSNKKLFAMMMLIALLKLGALLFVQLFIFYIVIQTSFTYRKILWRRLNWISLGVFLVVLGVHLIMNGRF